MGMTNSDIMEEYGFKADYAGKFDEYRAISSSLIEKNPNMEPSDAAMQAYNKVMGSV